MNENAIESVESLSMNVWISAPGEDVTPIVDWGRVSIPIGEAAGRIKKDLRIQAAETIMRKNIRYSEDGRKGENSHGKSRRCDPVPFPERNDHVKSLSG